MPGGSEPGERTKTFPKEVSTSTETEPVTLSTTEPPTPSCTPIGTVRELFSETYLRYSRVEGICPSLVIVRFWPETESERCSRPWSCCCW